MANEQYELYQHGTAAELASLITGKLNGGQTAIAPLLTAGAAQALTGSTPTEQSYLYRGSGAPTDGVATIKSIKGNTIRWNQLCTGVNDRQTIDGLTFSQSETGGLNVSGTVTTAPLSERVYISDTLTVKRDGRKYLCMLSKDIGIDIFLAGFTVSNQRRAFIFSNNYNGETINTAIAIVVNDGDTLNLSDVHASIFDLTTMFGAGNEPSTVAEFEALYPLPYYEYDAGSLMFVQMEGIETVGFNQWDEVWELGSISQVNGGDVANTDRIRSKNYIPVFGGMRYFINQSYGVCASYDGDKNYIGNTPYAITGKSGEYYLDPQENARYIRFSMTTTYGTTYKNDICINLHWSGRRNGEYEPYWSAQRLIAAGTLRRAGSVYDELTSTEAITRVGVVDLGTLTWTYVTSGESPYFSSNALTDAVYSSSRDNYKCARYDNVSVGSTGDATGIWIIDSLNVRLRDTSYTDAATFKAAMSGVMLHYELATPTVTPSDPLNMTYRVAADGTERVIVPTGEMSAPPVMEVAYGPDADGLRDLVLATIAPVENGLASENYGVGSYLIHGGTICKVTTAIASGEAIAIGTNVTATTVMAEVIALTQ